ncbi:cell wall hydrolase [Novosphingobium tardum]|uniref:Cell wall hydrolase n=1 Tax=Novosphingobium tardum TaxID=1538021 RepID=A0ABV8RKR7_9SPHN
MSNKLRLASGIAVAATFLSTLISADGSGASAQTLPNRPLATVTQPAPQAPQFVAQPVVQAVAAAPAEAAVLDSSDDDNSAAVDADTLAELIAAQPVPEHLSDELNCLAGAIYFESKGESLEGQLAVGRVIIARSRSGRFPASYCGVVYQQSQFSFVRGHSMPAIDKSGRNWKLAAKIAQIADDGSWKSPVEGALFFHAARVSPNWRLKRMARVDNHVFYR